MYRPITSLVANCRHREIMRRFDLAEYGSHTWFRLFALHRALVNRARASGLSFFSSGGCFGRDYAAWN
jgi:hypothetical protein